MKYLLRITLVAALLALPGLAIAGSGKEPPGQRENGNWGNATSESIENGFDQGAHASDPSDDGHGPGTDDEPRSGLPNVVDRGDLSKTMDALGF